MKGKVIDFNTKVEHFRSGKDSLQEELEKHLGAPYKNIEEELKKVVTRSPASIRDSLTSIMYLYQNRICSGLFLLSSRLQGVKKINREATRVAIALEILHLALLSHEFAGREPAGSIPVNVSDLLGGDYLFSEALSLAYETPQVIKGMSEVITRYVEAEFIKPSLSHNTPGAKKKYLQKLSYRYASLLALCGSLGSWHNGVSQEKVKKIAYFAHYMGIARQVKEELNYFQRSYPKWLRKTPKDIRINLPLLYILEMSPQKEKLIKIMKSSYYQKGDREIWEQEINQVDYSGYILQLINKNYQGALQMLSEFKTSGETTLLKQMLTKEAYGEL